MSVAQHTPGKWFWNGSEVRAVPAYRSARVDLPASWLIASVRAVDVTYAPELGANGRLISAAPELLAALSDMVLASESSMEVTAADGSKIVHPFLAAARAAIAKAIGGAE